jgi:zinc-ribbon domain
MYDDPNNARYDNPDQLKNPYERAKCRNCGTELPPGAAACPMCGTLTPQYEFGSGGATPSDPTIEAFYGTPSPGTPPPPSYYPTNPESHYGAPIATSYGSPSYGASSSPAYNTSPYIVPPPPPPTQAPKRSNRKSISIISGVALLLVVLIGASVLALLHFSSNNTATNPTPTITVTTTPAAVTPTASSAQNPYPPNTGTLVLNDPLIDNSRGYKWDEASFSGTDSCGFTGGAYHIVEKTGLICIPEANKLVLRNFAFEVNVKIVKGDNAGIAFRVNQVNKTFYSFDIAPDGSYALQVYTTKYTTLSQGTNAVINKGLNQSNLLAVVANGDLITVYVNGQIIDSVHDKTFSQGQVGALSFASNTNGAINDVIASNARVWVL